MEPLILYFVLFFPGIYASGLSLGADTIETIPFLPLREMGRTLTYTIPAIALIWYVILGKKDFFSFKPKKLKKKDYISFAAGLSGLIVISLGISLMVSLLSRHFDFATPPKVEAPVNITGWIVMVFSCLGTGYLEESFFRYYLLEKFEYSLPQTAIRVIFSTFLFSLCHIYEGPWGFINSVLAGILLSALFIRYGSLHGIAWAHGAYNIFVYIVGNLG